jgi:SRSO17 transposase
MAPWFQALLGRFALPRRTQQDLDGSYQHRARERGAAQRGAETCNGSSRNPRWDPEKVNERRLEVLLGESTTAPEEKGVLVIDEHGDRKWGKRTAHVGKQWLANIGKTENGVVSASSL